MINRDAWSSCVLFDMQIDDDDDDVSRGVDKGL